MRLVVAAGKEYHVGGKHLKEGDEFEVPDEDGKRWLAFGLAHDAGQEQRVPRRERVMRNRVMTADKTAEAEPESEPDKYKRTDLRAED